MFYKSTHGWIPYEWQNLQQEEPKDQTEQADSYAFLEQITKMDSIFVLQMDKGIHKILHWHWNFKQWWWSAPMWRKTIQRSLWRKSYNQDQTREKLVRTWTQVGCNMSKHPATVLQSESSNRAISFTENLKHGI